MQLNILTKYPIYIRNMFTLRTTSYNLRGNYILTLPVPKTTTYGLCSFSYHVAKLWNSLHAGLFSNFEPY